MFGRTLGLLGFGSIGQEIARRAHAFGMPIVVWSRRFADRVRSDARSQRRADPDRAPSPEDVAERADVLSVHLALTPDTRGIVNARCSTGCGPARTSSTPRAARSSITRRWPTPFANEQIRVGLDVYASEPAAAAGEFADPILSLPNVYGTHHIGASTDQAQEAIAAETVRIVAAYKDTGQGAERREPREPRRRRRTCWSCATAIGPACWRTCSNICAARDINVQETENVIFEGAEAAVARINLDGAPPDGLLAAIQDGNRDILDLHLVTI